MANPGAHPPQQFLELWEANIPPLPQGPFASDAELIQAISLQEAGLLDFARQFPFSPQRLDELRKRRQAGGQEHEVFLPRSVRGGARVWKVTHRGRWGLRRATPREYLARLDRLDANSLAHIRVEGIAVEQGEPRLVTSMDYVDGHHLSGPELDRRLREHHWEPAYDPDHLLSYQLRADGTIMRDAHPKNFIVTATRRLVPIDVIFVGFARFDLRLDPTPGEEELPMGEEAPPDDET